MKKLFRQFAAPTEWRKQSLLKKNLVVLLCETYSLEKSIFEIGTIILVKNLFVSKTLAGIRKCKESRLLQIP